MMTPGLLFAQSSDKTEVACVASFVPTFEPPTPQEMTEVLEDEAPEQASLSQGSDFHFAFLVDRSGSMRSLGRMQAAIDALKIFIRSLPLGCTFQVKSFGDRQSDLDFEDNTVIEYSQASKEYALK